jgi:hypothetical protein
MIDYQQPRRITHWYPVGVRQADLVQRLWSHEAAQERIGTQLTRVPNRYDQFKDRDGLTFGLAEGRDAPDRHGRGGHSPTEATGEGAARRMAEGSLVQTDPHGLGMA